MFFQPINVKTCSSNDLRYTGFSEIDYSPCACVGSESADTFYRLRLHATDTRAQDSPHRAHVFILSTRNRMRVRSNAPNALGIRPNDVPHWRHR